MTGTVFTSAIYMLGFAVLGLAVFSYKKTEDKQLLVTWIPLSVIIMQFILAFVAGTIQLVHIPVNTLSLGIVNILLGAFLWYRIIKKREVQKYSFNAYDVIFVLLLIAAVLYVCNIRYGLKTLDWSYRTVDPSARYRESMEYIRDQRVRHMYFAQLINGALIQMVMPWLKFDYLYKAYVLGDILQLLISSIMFYGTARRWTKDHFGHIVAGAASFFFIFGYPLNSTIWGFTYLGMSLYVIMALMIFADMFAHDEMTCYGDSIGRKHPISEGTLINIILLMIGCNAIFQCYVLFMPVTYLSIGFALLLKQFHKKNLISLETLFIGLGIFLLPVIYGFIYTYMDVFVTDESVDNLTVGSAFAAEGAIYRDLYSNFLFFVPVALLGIILMIKKKENHFLSWFTPMFTAMTLVMFAISYINRKVSTYYYYKNYFVLWLLTFLLIVYALTHTSLHAKLMTCFYMLSWTFVAIMVMGGIETRIQDNSENYIVDNKSMFYNDLLVYNWNTIHSPHYSQERMELIHYVYDTLQSGSATEGQIPLVASQEDSYLYESMTGQWLVDFEYWKQNDEQKTFIKNIKADCDYICVYTDSEVYANHQEYFDSLQRIYQNSAGFIAATVPAEESYE